MFNDVDPAPSYASDPEAARYAKLRSKFDIFRLLIVGRANAGKTTILQKIYNTTEAPVVLNSEGKEIDRSIVDPTVNRGMHDIYQELVFSSSPGFIFHDSPGLESGSQDEKRIIEAFIFDRSNRTEVNERIHVICICLPVDNDRPFSAGEMDLLSLGATGVPVVVIATKFDGLITKFFGALRDQGMAAREAREKSKGLAVDHFNNKLMPQLKNANYPPAEVIYAQNLHKPQTDCTGIVESIAKAITIEALQVLFVSTQRANARLCTRYAIGWYVTAKHKRPKK